MPATPTPPPAGTDRNPAESPSRQPAPAPPSEFGNPTLALFLISLLGLFLEMMLIRWVSTEVRIFAYLQNTVLVVCFLGLGVGCLTCRRPVAARQILLPLLVLVLILAVPVTRSGAGMVGGWLSVLDDLTIWYNAVASNFYEGGVMVAVGLLVALFLMILLWDVFLPIGRILGRLLDDHPNTIWAYSVNVGGSLLGIWLFTLMSASYLPPGAWGLAAGLLLLPFLGKGRERKVNLGLTAAIALGCWAAGLDAKATRVIWSPYQKLTLLEGKSIPDEFPGKYLINVNNVGYQGMIDLREEEVRANPEIREEERGMGQYDVPLHFRPTADHALIVGAGSGNDVAGALRGNAKAVTAVEIDPAIVTRGRAHHPERPYADPRVRVVVDDARSFFATTNERYDLVVFGLLDSHTTTAMTNARLDHYVYTRESLQRVRSLLTDDGVVVLSFEAQKPYIANRMAQALTEVFGRDPLVFRIPASRAGWGGVIFVTGNQDTIARALANSPRLAVQVQRWQQEWPIRLEPTSVITTDDWPYIYLAAPRIPTLYYLLGLLLVGLLARARLQQETAPLGLGGWDRSQMHFFFLGAAFMLLEVQNISKASVVLGSTWQVNAVIVSGVLVMILLSNLVVFAWPCVPLWLAAVGLVGSCLGLYFFDLSRLAFLPYTTKALLAGSLTTLPMFFAGILFIDAFKNTQRKDLALGANLLGALAGGLLQSVTFITGIKALLLLVAALYLLALLTRPRAQAAPPPAA